MKLYSKEAISESKPYYTTGKKEECGCVVKVDLSTQFETIKHCKKHRPKK